MNKNDINIIVTGDYHVTNKLSDYMGKQDKPEKIFGNLLPMINEADLSITNIEFPVTTSTDMRLKMGMLAKIQPRSLQALKNAGFNLASIGNNHTLDYGHQGVADTLEHCHNYSLDTVGAGMNLAEARQIYYKEIKGKKIAILNFSENEYNVANDNHGGANPLNIVNNVYDIQEAKRNADVVLVIIHGGPDFCHHPTPRMVDQYRFYIDQGASAIIGHHTHVVSGYETYKDCPIVYSLGNFIYPYNVDRERNETLVAHIAINDDGLQLNILPYYYNPIENVLEKIAGDERMVFDKKIAYYNETLHDKVALRKAWGEQISKVDKMRYLVLLSNMPYLFFRIFKKLKMLGLLNKILWWQSIRFLPIYNLVRCETHRDALLYFFEESFDDLEKSKKYITRFNGKIYNSTREELR